MLIVGQVIQKKVWQQRPIVPFGVFSHRLKVMGTNLEFRWQTRVILRPQWAAPWPRSLPKAGWRGQTQLIRLQLQKHVKFFMLVVSQHRASQLQKGGQLCYIKILCSVIREQYWNLILKLFIQQNVLQLCPKKIMY